jgi:threonylcarbamoyladenosine tRNA methylthiotransferase MtaB
MTEIVTFGCRLNAYESEVIRREAGKAGLEDAIVFNTCAVTGEAMRQARQAVRKARKARPRSRIIVTGCGAQTAPTEFAAMPEVDLILGNAEKLDARYYAPKSDTRVIVGDIMPVRGANPNIIDLIEGRTRGFMQVQTGCDHRCTFCVIPFGRGNSRSVAMEDAVEQARRLVANGYSEIVLSGVDITSWGFDLSGAPKLGTLVRRILKEAPELKRLRISSIDCIEADPELMRALAEEERLMPHLHLSLQSGDDMILKRMKRRHSRAEAVAFCNEARRLRPEIVFGADLIAGFPTETDEMFANSERLVEDCGLTFLHVFPFSPRPETPAARMPQLPKDEVKLRARRLRVAGAAALSSFLAGEVGKRRTVLVETGTTGRTEHFAPVRFSHTMQSGAIVSARISGHANGALEAQIV